MQTKGKATERVTKTKLNMPKVAYSQKTNKLTILLFVPGFGGKINNDAHSYYWQCSWDQLGSEIKFDNSASRVCAQSKEPCVGDDIIFNLVKK